MYQIGDKYRHIITKEVVQIYFIYRSTVNQQVRIFDLISSAIGVKDATGLDMNLKLRKMDLKDIRTWHLTLEEFEQYFDAV